MSEFKLTKYNLFPFFHLYSFAYLWAKAILWLLETFLEKVQGIQEPSAQVSFKK